MTGTVLFRPFAFEMAGHHAIGSHLPQRAGGNGMGQHAVDEQAPANLYGQEHSWISATGAHWIDQGSRMKDHAFAGREIRRGHGQRDAQFFERFDLQQLIQKSDHALVTGKAVARERPTGNMLEAHPGGNLLEIRSRESAAIRGADERAHTGSGNIADGDVLFFEDLENADVGHAASKATAQSQTDAHLRWMLPHAGRRRREPASKRLYRTNNLTQTLHGNPHTIPVCPAILPPLRLNPASKMPAPD